MPDSGRIAAAFHQQADEYDRHVFVQKRVVAQLAEAIRLHLAKEPEQILDVGTGTGALLERLQSRYLHAGFTGVDIALNMCLRTRQKLASRCQVVNAAAEYLPFKNGAFDLSVSASALQWVSNLSAVLHELNRVTKPGGDICLAFFCEGTLAELQDSFRAADSRGSSGNSRKISRLHSFWTVDAVKSMVNEMAFTQVVVAVETEVDWYDDLHSLLRSIKNIGAGTVTGGAGGLGWRGLLQETSRLYLERYGHNGRIPATYKVLYLNARAGL